MTLYGGPIPDTPSERRARLCEALAEAERDLEELIGRAETNARPFGEIVWWMLVRVVRADIAYLKLQLRQLDAQERRWAA